MSAMKQILLLYSDKYTGVIGRYFGVHSWNTYSSTQHALHYTYGAYYTQVSRIKSDYIIIKSMIKKKSACIICLFVLLKDKI